MHSYGQRCWARIGGGWWVTGQWLCCHKHRNPYSHLKADFPTDIRIWKVIIFWKVSHLLKRRWRERIILKIVYFHSIVSPDVNPTENFRLPAKVDQHHQSRTLKVFLPQAINLILGRFLLRGFLSNVIPCKAMFAIFSLSQAFKQGNSHYPGSRVYCC